MFRVKICGVTTREDAVEAVESGADAIGLNFYPKSSRCVSDARAKSIADWVRSVRPETLRVGVFVNRSPDEILAMMGDDAVGIDVAQLHGDESPAEVAAIKAARLVRARRIDDRGLEAIADDLRACRDAGRAPDAVLVDAAAPAGEYGGTGQTVSWPGVVDHQRFLGPTPLILAGGLTPDNVAEAIRVVRPYGVDVASGVESAPGVKDPIKVRDFVQAARAAFADEGIG